MMKLTLSLLFSVLLVCTSVFSVAAQAEEDERSVVESLRDPTRPLGYVAQGGANGDDDWHLDSVLISSSRKVAVINGQSVKERGWVNGAQVTRIQSGKVILLVDGIERVLTTRTNIRKTKVEG